MRTEILAAKREFSPMLEERVVLMREREKIKTQQQILNAFHAHYNISESQYVVLTTTTEPVDEHFFASLAHVRRVHHDSQVLLGSENQKLGLEILERSSKLLNSAFQKLYRSVLREFKDIDFENPQISSSLRKSLKVLAERPSLFRTCLDSFAEARERKLSDGFLNALSGSQSDTEAVKAANPIEYSAHDPLRYIGDMLAWVHSAAVSEKDALEVLFIIEGDEIAKNIERGTKQEPWNKDDAETSFDGQEVIKELVRRALEGVARLVRQRVEEVMHSNEDATTAFKVANLIKFYETTFAKLLGAKSVLIEVLQNLENSALRHFGTDVKDSIATMKAEHFLPPSDQSVPEPIEEALKNLETLLTSCETSLINTDDQEARLSLVFTQALDPFIAFCDELSQGLTEPQNHIFMMNCLAEVKMVLESFSIAEGRLRDLLVDEEEHVEKLVEFQLNHLLHASGLVDLHRTLSDFTDSAEDLEKMASLDILRPEALTEASEALDDFLPSGYMDALELLKYLHNATLAQDITKKAVDRFCDDFESVERKLVAADEMKAGDDVVTEGAQQPTFRQNYPRTGSEVRVLLS